MKWIKWIPLFLIGFLAACDDDNDNNGPATKGTDAGVTVDFGMTEKNVLKNVGTVNLTIQLDAPAMQAIKVAVEAVVGASDDAAREGVDFVFGEIGKVVTIPVGDTLALIPVEILDDSKVSATRTATFRIVNVSDGQNVGKQRECRLHIMSNAFVEFEKTTWEMYESSTSPEAPEEWQNKRFVPLLITGEIEEPSTVVVRVQDNTASEYIHFNLKEHEVVIAPGDRRVLLEILPVDDDIANDDRTFTLTIKEVRGGNLTVGKAARECEVTIKSEEVSVAFESETLKGKEGDENIEIPITVDKKITEEVVVTVTAVPALSTAVEGVDYEIVSKQVEIGLNRRGSVLIRSLRDNEVNEPKKLVLRLSSVVAGSADISVNRNQCTLEILNNDFPEYTETIWGLEEAKENIVTASLPAVNRDRVIVYEIVSKEAKPAFFSSAQMSYTLPANSELLELPVPVGSVEQWPGNATLAVLKVISVDGVVIPNPQEISLKVTEKGIYRKFIGNWKLKCDSPNEVNNPAIVTVSQLEFGKSVTCQAALLGSEIYTWRMDFNDKNNTFTVVLNASLGDSKGAALILWNSQEQNSLSTHWLNENTLVWDTSDYICIATVGFGYLGGWYYDNIQMIK